MKRHALLYAPAGVCGVLAILFWRLGRTDVLVVFACVSLGLALLGQAAQIIHDVANGSRRNGHRGVH